MEKYLGSNLVIEASSVKKMFSSKQESERCLNIVKNGIEICRLKIRDKDEQERFGIDVGNYTTIYTKKVIDYSDFELENISKIVSEELMILINEQTGVKKERLNVIVAGLGNREVTSDSLGPNVVDALNVTRHLKIIDKKMFIAAHLNSVSAIACGVFGKTGIETLELMRGIVSQIVPDVIIVVDSLAAREYSRLASVIQLSDTGIIPGAGIGNKQEELSRKTLGVPVISIGIPTVVAASTFICDNLQKSVFLRQIDDETRSRLEELKNFFVTPKDCDLILRSSAKLISSSIEMALL